LGFWTSPGADRRTGCHFQLSRWQHARLACLA
jgi:hypothetical protein